MENREANKHLQYRPCHQTGKEIGQSKEKDSETDS